MTDNEILNKLQEITRTVLGRNDIVLTKRTKFDDLGVNSFVMVQLVCEIENEFDIEIPNAVIVTIKNVPAAVRYIKKRINLKR